MAQILLLCNDLMFTSNVGSVVQASGRSQLTCASGDKLVQSVTDETRLVLIDLTARHLELATLIPSLKSKDVEFKILAFGPHVAVDQLTSARESGCDIVMTRGEFTSTLPDIVAGA